MRAPIRGDAGRRTESSGREERGLIVALPSLTLRVPNPKRNPDREGGEENISASPATVIERVS